MPPPPPPPSQPLQPAAMYLRRPSSATLAKSACNPASGTRIRFFLGPRTGSTPLVTEKRLSGLEPEGAPRFSDRVRNSSIVSGLFRDAGANELADDRKVRGAATAL